MLYGPYTERIECSVTSSDASPLYKAMHEVSERNLSSCVSYLHVSRTSQYTVGVAKPEEQQRQDSVQNIRHRDPEPGVNRPYIKRSDTTDLAMEPHVMMAVS